MKKLLTCVLLFGYTNIFGQSGNELFRVHNFTNITSLNGVSNPSEGSISYLTNIKKMMYYDGLQWQEIGGGDYWSLEGNSGTNLSTDFLGTTDDRSLNIRTNNINRVQVETNGNLRALNDLVVEGAAYNNTAFDAGSATIIDFQQSNLAYTNTSAQNNFTLQNLKDGGTYTLSVRGTSSGTASFTATGFSFRSVSNGKTVANTHTLYTFLVMGNIVYINMITGL
jgi:hypothetical protein